jgi:glutamine synthetase
LLAAGLQGIEKKLELPAEFKGNAYESDVQRFPHSMRDAIADLERGKMARSAFGDDVVDHYLNYARTEQAQFDKVVTDYERARLFERG